MRFDPDAWSLHRHTFGTLNCVLITPLKEDPSSLVVLCHGFGASGTDLLGSFEDILYHLPEDCPKSAFLFPEAPIDLSDEGMYGAHAWWRLNMAQLMLMNATNSFDKMKDVVPEGIEEARNALCSCIEECRTANKWSDTPVVLGGFSQGAMLTVETALRGTVKPIVGLIVFSGALICESLWRAAAKDKPLEVPLVQSHGRQDQVLAISTGRWLNGLLRDIGCDGSLFEFDGPHTIPGEGPEQVANMLVQLNSPKQ